MLVEGLMAAQKILNAVESVKVVDHTSNHELLVTFDAQADQRSGRFMSMFSSSPQVTETGGLQYRRDLLTM